MEVRLHFQLTPAQKPRKNNAKYMEKYHVETTNQLVNEIE